jgi:hypothetical protein
LSEDQRLALELHPAVDDDGGAARAALQYCDLASTVGLIACVDEAVARAVATTILDRLVRNIDRPVPPRRNGAKTRPWLPGNAD